MSHKKKPDIVKAADTVQGFITYSKFCADVVRMLGDGVFLVKPNIYDTVLKLIFQGVCVKVAQMNIKEHTQSQQD